MVSDHESVTALGISHVQTHGVWLSTLALKVTPKFYTSWSTFPPFRISPLIALGAGFCRTIL